MALRKGLQGGGQCIVCKSNRLVINTQSITVDLYNFESMVQTKTRDSLRQAIKIYDDYLLRDWDDSWIDAERKRVHIMYVEALRELIRSEMNSGDYQSAIPYLRKYIRLKSNEEGAYRDLMTALTAVGERLQARDVFLKYRSILEGQGGLLPPADIVQAFEKLNQPEITTGQPLPSPHIKSFDAGSMPVNSLYYVNRDADIAVQESLDTTGSVIVLRGPRQTGKSSLLNRALSTIYKEKATIIFTDFSQFSNEDIKDLDTLCMRVIGNIMSQVDENASSSLTWNPMHGAGGNMEHAIHHSVLKKIPGRIVWAMEEVDRVLVRPFSTEFFSFLRGYHEKGKTDLGRLWKNLTMIMTVTTEPHLYIKDLNRSPFNIVPSINLFDFTLDQVEDLNNRYGNPVSSREGLKAVMLLTGGQPYLVQRVLYTLSHKEDSMDHLFSVASSPSGPFGEHLHQTVGLAMRDSALQVALVKLVARMPAERADLLRLECAGIIINTGKNEFKFRCELYRKFVTEHISLEAPEETGSVHVEH